MGEHLQPELHPAGATGSFIAGVHLTPLLHEGRGRGPAIKSVTYSLSPFFLSFLSLFSLHFSFSAVLLLLLKGLEQKVAEAMHSILNDDKQGEWVGTI